MKFGSFLYGTQTPTSDLDLKLVHVPDVDDILLRFNGEKDVISSSRKKAEGEKNTAADVDRESYSLHKYMRLIVEGQTVALDMLFAPDFALTQEPSYEWKLIRANKEKLITSKYMSFLGYCRQQANKYGIKGSRMAAARRAMEEFKFLMEAHGAHTKIRDVLEFIKLTGIEHIDFIYDGKEHMFDVCGRKCQVGNSLKVAYEMYYRLFDEYGSRARAAEANDGIDWKALSHAVRIGRQAVELLTTGTVIFPRPDAAHLLEIKTGKLEYKVVSAEIEQLLVDVEETAKKSTLRAEPDHEWIKQFLLKTYGNEVKEYLEL